MENVKEDVNLLHDLIRQHDVVFLLTDSRESRWLPTVIASVEQKVCCLFQYIKILLFLFIQIVLCCAVGFDSYVIIRHGVPTEETNSPSTKYKNLLSGNKLGCYFCNDVVAPGDVCLDNTIFYS
jgi:ubiquitin-like modifier-activating enzyme ATG7